EGIEPPGGAQHAGGDRGVEPAIGADVEHHRAGPEKTAEHEGDVRLDRAADQIVDRVDGVDVDREVLARGEPDDRHIRAGGDHPRLHCRAAARIARQTVSGVAGIAISLTPSGFSASASALPTAGIAPTAPASPAPLTPSGLVLVGTGFDRQWIGEKLSARGIA